jgi:hypothetical protein
MKKQKQNDMHACKENNAERNQAYVYTENQKNAKNITNTRE